MLPYFRKDGPFTSMTLFQLLNLKLKPVSSTEPVSDIQQQVNTAWWASLPTSVQALPKIADPAQRLALFDSLISQGYGRFLMVSIMLDDFDPYSVFSMLSGLGYTWINPVNQIEVGYPGQYSAPGIPPGPGSLGPYPTIPPPNEIVIPPLAQLLAPNANITALLASWYPPYAPPPPPPPVPTNPVGNQVAPGSAYYLNAPGVNESNYPNGSVYPGPNDPPDPRGSFIHIVTMTPFGNESEWRIMTAPAA